MLLNTLEVVLLTFACSKDEADPQRAVESLPAPKESPHPSAPQLEPMVSSPLGSLLLQGLPEWASLPFKKEVLKQSGVFPAS